MVGLTLAACVNREPQERAAFIVWLQVQIIDAPQARVPDLDKTQHDELGDYVKQYKVLSNFQHLAQEHRLNLAGTLEHEQLNTLAQLQARSDVLKADRQALLAGQQAMQQAQSRAAAELTEWEQPPDLKPIYAQAYDKVVTQPALVLGALSSTALSALNDALAVIDFMDLHADQITLQGDAAAVRDPSVQAELNLLLQTLNSHSAAVQDAQARLRALHTG